ncbi:hypothetical protein [Enterococcus gallinarum]|uniref:hypothetical protein n=1 Tax=Enterococcus gallinarum TaxID=1353 RepID=UPI002433F630|nr:hypothetical protein [Enterococcus gallinarum]
MNPDENLKATNDLNEYLINNGIKNIRADNGSIIINDLSAEEPIIYTLNNNLESNVKKISKFI